MRIGGQHVVEVVRDAAGQRAHALEPLRAQKLRLDKFAARDLAAELFVGLPQLDGPRVDETRHRLELAAGLPREPPFFSERTGELEHFHDIEWLF
jgi:hypothetical protein